MERFFIMKYYFTVFLLIVISWQACAQKHIAKNLDASHISNIKINGNNLFKINITSQATSNIDMLLKVEGEDNEQILLLSRVQNDTLYLASSYQPLFTPPDNKSSAHKQVSIELVLQIPENVNLFLESDIASVFISGNYHDVLIELLNGHFKTSQFLGNLVVNTLLGDIYVETNYAVLDCYTRKGAVFQEKLVAGVNQISLNSVNGDITVTKTE